MGETLKPRILSSRDLSHIPKEEMVKETVGMGFPEAPDLLEKVAVRAFFKIESGAKTLLLFIYLEKGAPNILRAMTFLSKEEKYQANTGDTTVAYSEGLELIKDSTAEFRKDIIYCLDTNNKKMIRWAMDAGSKIFRWEDSTLTESQEKSLEDNGSEIISGRAEFSTTVRYKKKNVEF